VAPPAQRNAVQLLTVHGAKGLEARVVFIMDSAPERAGTDTATVLVDWPVELDRPARCAFVYSEGDVPPSLAPAMLAEQVARQREELNGLYVAMTRAREQVVFSRTEPHIAAPGASWWQRVEALVAPWLPADVASSAAGQGRSRCRACRRCRWRSDVAPASSRHATTAPRARPGGAPHAGVGDRRRRLRPTWKRWPRPPRPRSTARRARCCASRRRCCGTRAARRFFDAPACCGPATRSRWRR
jgi:ATP-dependent helicase/nuclease subunit A